MGREVTVEREQRMCSLSLSHIQSQITEHTPQNCEITSATPLIKSKISYYSMSVIFIPPTTAALIPSAAL